MIKKKGGEAWKREQILRNRAGYNFLINWLFGFEKLNEAIMPPNSMEGGPEERKANPLVPITHWSPLTQRP